MYFLEKVMMVGIFLAYP